MAVVLDASAVLALVKDEPGADTVVKLLLEAERAETGHTAFLSTVNWVEVRQYALAEALVQLEREGSPIALLPFTARTGRRTVGADPPSRVITRRPRVPGRGA